MAALSDILDRIFLPPGLFLSLFLVAVLLCVLRRARTALVVACAGCALVGVLSLRPVAEALLAPLEGRYADLDLEAARAEGASAIVLLGGGLAGNDQLSSTAMSRAVNAVILARHLDLPVIASGGPVAPGATPEAQAAVRLLVSLGVAETAVIAESESLTTWENAVRVHDLDPEGPLILVTSAWHMPRAVACFRALGMTVVPAPTDRSISSRPLRPRDWLPDASALEGSLSAIHEYGGLLAYRLVHGVRWAGT